MRSKERGGFGRRDGGRSSYRPRDNYRRRSYVNVTLPVTSFFYQSLMLCGLYPLTCCVGAVAAGTAARDQDLADALTLVTGDAVTALQGLPSHAGNWQR